MPSGLAFRVLPTTRAKLRKAVYRNEQISRTNPLRRCRRRGPNPPRSSSRAREPCPADSERLSTTTTEAVNAPATRAASTPRREPKRIGELEADCRIMFLPNGEAVGRSLRAQPGPTKPNGDLDANIEVAPSRRVSGLFIDASLRRCCHRCRLTPRIPFLRRTRQNQTLELGRRPLLLSILSVGYTHVADGCPPLTSARQQKRCCHHLRSAARKRPADAGYSWSSIATLPPRRDPHRPCQTRDSGYLRNATRADWLRNATRFAPGAAPRKPRRASPAPATSHALTLRTSNLGVDSRRSEGVATLVAEQHANHSTTEPSSTGSRIVRAEAHLLRSPASPSGLDASADTNRRVCDRRLDTTDHPHEVGTGDVATTAPAGAAQGALGVR
jgi:hypothetical protein